MVGQVGARHGAQVDVPGLAAQRHRAHVARARFEAEPVAQRAQHGIGRLLGRGRRRAGAQVELACGVVVVGREHGDVDAGVAGQRAAVDDIAHQVDGADDGGRVAGQRGGALGRRVERHAGTVDGHDQFECAQLARVLGQREQARGGHLARHGGARERFHDDGIGAHVQAEGGLVAGQRLQVVDHAVARMHGRGHAHAVDQFGQAGAGHGRTERRFERAALGMADQAVEVEGLDEGVARQQGRREVVELGARDGRNGGEQAVGHGEHFDGVVEPAPQHGRAHAGALLERQRHLLVFKLADGDEQA